MPRRTPLGLSGSLPIYAYQQKVSATVFRNDPARQMLIIGPSRTIMGNQREIRQVYPVARLGVAIPIRAGFEPVIASLLAGYEIGHFYTCIAPPDEDFSIANMDFGETVIERSRQSRFIIRSGGKMWCGYAAFREHIAAVAPYLEDALFLVGDEEDYIDQFLISEGVCEYRRVHAGYWLPVEEYIRAQFPAAGA